MDFMIFSRLSYMTNESIPKKMGRPKKCPIQIERTKTLCRSLCYEQKIPCNAYQFEKGFETTIYKPRRDKTIQRKQKFYRLFNGVHTISESTLKQISEMENTENSLALYYSSLWEALTPNKWDIDGYPLTYTERVLKNSELQEEREKHWISFFKTLRPSLQKIALKSDDKGIAVIKGVNQFTSAQLLKEGDIESLACAIAIYRASPLHKWRFELSGVIAKLLGWTLANRAFKGSQQLIVDILVNQYRALDYDVNIYDRNFSHSDTVKDCFLIFDLIIKNREFITRCNKLGLVVNTKDLKHIFVLSERGDKQLIYEEMEKTLNSNGYEFNAKSNGLHLLISGLNKHRRSKVSVDTLGLMTSSIY